MKCDGCGSGGCPDDESCWIVWREVLDDEIKECLDRC